MANVLKLAAGVSSSKLNAPPNNCMPSKANIKMNKNNRKSNDIMERIEASNEMTKFRNDDQYLIY